jgi:hypothetical protein
MTLTLGSSTTTLGSTIAMQGNTPLVPTAMRNYNLDNLTSLNYLMWVMRMTVMLKQVDLWDIVSGTM